MERKLDEAFTALEEQTVNLSTTIAQLGIEAGKLHSQVAQLERMVKQLQEQQEKMLATTGKLNDAGEKLSQEIESLSGIILEKKSAMDLVSQAIVSVAQNSLKNEKNASNDKQAVAELSTKFAEDLSSAATPQGKLKSLEESLQPSSASLALDKLRKKIDDNEKTEEELKETVQKSQSIHERARRAIALKQKASHGRDEENSQERSASPALS